MKNYYSFDCSQPFENRNTFSAQEPDLAHRPSFADPGLRGSRTNLQGVRPMAGTPKGPLV